MFLVLEVEDLQPLYTERPQVKTLDSLKINSVSLEGNERYTRA